MNIQEFAKLAKAVRNEYDNDINENLVTTIIEKIMPDSSDAIKALVWAMVKQMDYAEVDQAIEEISNG